MKINKIRIKNFYSIKDMEIDFSLYKGLVLIIGKNKDSNGSNGSGKSAVFEAITWGLFGKTIRKSTEDSLVNFDTKKHCSVELWLNDDAIHIKRSKRPTLLEFEYYGEEHTCATVTETQMKIDQLMNTNYHVFLASMVFGQHNDIDFVSSKPDDKRRIIKNFLGLHDLFECRDKIKKIKLGYSSKVKECDAALATQTGSLEDVEKNLERIESEKGSILEKYGLTKDDLNDTSLEDILAAEKEREELVEQYNKAAAIANELEDKHEDICTRLRNEDYDRSTSCNSCGQKVSDVTTKEELLALEADILPDYDAHMFVANNIRLAIDRIKIKIPSSEYKKIEEWQALKAKRESFLRSRRDINSRLKDLEEERKTNARSLDIMKFWEIAFSEQGIIKFIIRNILDYFNDRITYYLGYLTNGQYRLIFDDTLEEKVYIGGSQTYYMSLSGGERRKINLAVLLALHDLLSLTDKEQSDILFFDEVTENLDEESTNGLYILLQELKKKKTIFLITHNDSLKSMLDSSQELVVRKSNGVTKLEN